MKHAGLNVALLVLVLTTIGCDRVTKQLAIGALAGGGSRSYLSDTVRLEYAENTGGFLSLGENLPGWARRSLFAYGTGVLLAGLVVLAVRQRWGRAALAGVCLIWAGGASNLIDRLARGSVVDFMNVGIGPVRTGIFNVADLAVVIGILLLFTAHLAEPGGPKP